MCDTIVALGPATIDGSTLFGKNSDREPDEVQNICVYPEADHLAGESVQATYISLPQVERTNRVLLSRPFWMFGAEMGANEHNVVIGNEALFTREKPGAVGLTGMDLLRLALERSATAKQALHIIIELLECYGQGGKCGYRQKIKYMNSFLIADPHEAYVLETVKKWWAWKKVSDIWSISNIISLRQDFDECSPSLIENAVKKGYCKSESDFDFRKCYSDRVYTWGAFGAPRECRSRELLQKYAGRLDSRAIMNILRDHGESQDWAPDRQSKGTICMHAANKLTRPSQSVGSLVAKLEQKRGLYYTTGASNPCMSPFFPVFSPGADLPAGYKEGQESYDAAAYWWLAERLHRKALSRFKHALGDIQADIADYEARMLTEVESGDTQPTQQMVDEYFRQARDLLEQWGHRQEHLPLDKPGRLFARFWKKYNRLNGVTG